MSKCHLIENQPLLREIYIYKDPPLLSYRKERSLENVLVRAKLIEGQSLGVVFGVSIICI